MNDAKDDKISIFRLIKEFPDDAAAEAWFKSHRWPDGERYCPKCGCCNTREVKSRKPMPYWCPDCRSYFSLKTGTVMEGSNIGIRKWLLAMYLLTKRPKGISSVQLSKDIGVCQKTAWFMAHRIREGFPEETARLSDEVEIDEMYVGGREKNKHANKRLRTGKVVAEPLKPGATFAKLVYDHVESYSVVYTDDHKGYVNLKDRYYHETVSHSTGEYVRGEVHTNGIESFWAIIKHGYKGVYHSWSRKHLHRLHPGVRLPVQHAQPGHLTLRPWRQAWRASVCDTPILSRKSRVDFLVVGPYATCCPAPLWRPTARGRASRNPKVKRT